MVAQGQEAFVLKVFPDLLGPPSNLKEAQAKFYSSYGNKLSWLKSATDPW
jgi:hypothetical protein